MLILTSFILAALFGSALAVPYRDSKVEGPSVTRRDDTNNSTAFLEPVVPPAVNPGALDTLALDTEVTLAWAGAAQAAQHRRRRDLMKRSSGVLVQTAFTFKHPAVTLDHSAYVSAITCSGGILTGTLTDTAYKYAKSNWAGVSDVLFVTSVDGCGMDDENDYFHATAITFSDNSKTFTARGSSARYKDIVTNYDLEFGDVGTHNLRSAIDKRGLFDFLDFDKEASSHLEWKSFPPADKDAPWSNAALIYKWGKEGGEEDDSYKKGEKADPNGHHKRSNDTSLHTRDISYGMALYCVDCGFYGSATVYGRLKGSVFPPSIDHIQTGIRGRFGASLGLGVEAYVKYEKEWTRELFRQTLPGGFEIPLLISVGPFVSVSVQASVEIAATGTLLIGAGLEWPNVDISLDLVDSSGTYAHGLWPPNLSHKAEATGELSVEGKLGLPVELGLGIDLLEGIFEASVGIVDTPAIVAEGKFEVSATVTDDGTIEHDINGGCYGIAWDVHLENTLKGKIEASLFGDWEHDLIDPMESDPIAEGCIGYVDDGTHGDDSDNPNRPGSGTGMSGNGMNSGGNGLGGGSRGSAKPAASVVSSSSTTTTKTSTTSPTSSSTSKTTSTTASTSSSKITSTTSSASTSKTISTSTSTPTSSKTTGTSSKITSTTKSTVTTTPTSKTSTTTSKPTSTTIPTSKITTSATSKTTSTAKTTSLSTSTTKPQSTSSSTKPACTPTATAVATPSASLTCKKVTPQASVPSSFNFGPATTVKTVDLCAASCLRTAQCLSFGYDGRSSCQLYNKAVKSLGVASKSGLPQLTFYDRGCYANTTCSA